MKQKRGIKIIITPGAAFFLTILLLIISPVDQTMAKNGPVAQPGYSIKLLNDDLEGPVELDFDPAGNIFVANEGASGVWEYENFISKLEPKGKAISREFISELEGSSGLAVDNDGNLYVSQNLGLPLRKYDSTGTLIFEFDTHRPELSDPNTLTLTDDGRLLAAVESTTFAGIWQIIAFDTESGNRLDDFTPPFQFSVSFIAYQDGKVFIAGIPTSTITEPLLVAEEGQTPSPLTFADPLPSELNGLAVGGAGELFFTDGDGVRLFKAVPNDSVNLIAEGFEMARGLAVRDGCVFATEFRTGLDGALYQVCGSEPELINKDDAIDVAKSNLIVLGPEEIQLRNVRVNGNVVGANFNWQRDDNLWNYVRGSAFLEVPENYREYVIHEASIIIDGNFSDWAGVPIAITDEQGDHIGPENLAPGDAKELRIARDANYIYFMMGLYGSPTDHFEVNVTTQTLDGGDVVHSWIVDYGLGGFPPFEEPGSLGGGEISVWFKAKLTDPNSQPVPAIVWPLPWHPTHEPTSCWNYIDGGPDAFVEWKLPLEYLPLEAYDGKYLRGSIGNENGADTIGRVRIFIE